MTQSRKMGGPAVLLDRAATPPATRSLRRNIGVRGLTPLLLVLLESCFLAGERLARAGGGKARPFWPATCRRGGSANRRRRTPAAASASRRLARQEPQRKSLWNIGYPLRSERIFKQSICVCCRAGCIPTAVSSPLPPGVYSILFLGRESCSSSETCWNMSSSVAALSAATI